MRKAFATSFIAFLLICSFIFAFLSYFKLFVPSLSCFFVLALLSCFFVFALLSYFFVPTLISLSMLALLSFSMLTLLSYFVLGLALICFLFSALRIFKQTLSNKSLSRQLTSLNLMELLYLFLIFGLLSKKAIASIF